MAKRVLWISALFLLWYTSFFGSLFGAEPPVTLVLSPQANLCLQGNYVKVTWRIPKNLDNRWYSVAWAANFGISGSTFKEMNDASPITYERMVELECDDYVFEACVYRRDRSKKCVQKLWATLAQ